MHKFSIEWHSEDEAPDQDVREAFIVAETLRRYKASWEVIELEFAIALHSHCDCDTAYSFTLHHPDNPNSPAPWIDTAHFKLTQGRKNA